MLPYTLRKSAGSVFTLGNLLLSWYREPTRRQGRAELLLPPLAPCSWLPRTDPAAGERCFPRAETETVLALGFRLPFVCAASRWRPTSAGAAWARPRAGGAGSARCGRRGAGPPQALGRGCCACPCPRGPRRRFGTASVPSAQPACGGGRCTKPGTPGNEQPRNRCLETQAAASCSARFKICTAVLQTPKISARNM